MRHALRACFESQRRCIWARLLGAFLLLIMGTASLTNQAAADAKLTTEQALHAIQKLGPKAQGHTPAIAAWNYIAKLPASELPVILASMNDANPLANNWLRGAVDAIAERTLRAAQPFPVAELEAYLSDTSHSPRSRRLAFEWIIQADPTRRQELIPQLISDPSLELRREAVADLLDKAQAALDQEKKQTAIALYRSSLDSARDLDQIDAAAEKLRELGERVELPLHFGFLMKWHLIAPFDNTDTAGFDKAYPPEKNIDLSSSYEGKQGDVQWIEHTTEDQYGMVDLDEVLGPHKGAVAYAVAFFKADEARAVDLRIGSINANKVWLNGKLLTANHVYHSGRGIDQYSGSGSLKKGRNVVLLKICQNEQKEPWAQDWEFQLRVCDSLGTAVLARDRR